MKYVSFCLAFFACVVHADVQIKWLADVTADRAETVTGAQSGVVYNASLHMANMSNPHNVTAVQVGTLTSNEIYSILSTINQSGESLRTVTIVDNVDSNCFWRFEGDKIVQYSLGSLATNWTATLSEDFMELTGGTRPAWTNNTWPFTDAPWNSTAGSIDSWAVYGPNMSAWWSPQSDNILTAQNNAKGTVTISQSVYYPTNAPVATGRFFGLNEPASSSVLRSYHYGDPEIVESSSALFTFADSVITDFNYDNYDAVAAGGVVAIPWSIGGIAVTGIAAQAFSPHNENYKISTVYLPRTITAIAEQAFYGCADLRLVVSLGNKPTIGSEAFVNNNALLSFIVPNSTATNWLTNVVSGSVSANVRRPDVYADKFYERGKSLATVQYVDDTFETKLPPQPENPSLRYLNGWRQWAEKDWMTTEETAEAINNAVGGAFEEINYPVTSVNGMTGDVVIDINAACSNLLTEQGFYTSRDIVDTLTNDIEVLKNDKVYELYSSDKVFTRIDGGTNLVVYEIFPTGPLTTNVVVTLSPDFLETIGSTRPSWTTHAWPFSDGLWTGFSPFDNAYSLGGPNSAYWVTNDAMSLPVTLYVESGAPAQGTAVVSNSITSAYVTNEVLRVDLVYAAESKYSPNSTYSYSAAVSGTQTVMQSWGNQINLVATNNMVLTFGNYPTNVISRVAISLYSGTNSVTFLTNRTSFAINPVLMTNSVNSLLFRSVGNSVFSGVQL